MMGDPDQEVVATVQRRLVERGCGPLEASGVFDAGTRAVVRLFQTRFLITVEGNTNDNGSREGIGVFQRNGRKVAAINRGFIDYSGR